VEKFILSFLSLNPLVEEEWRKKADTKSTLPQNSENVGRRQREKTPQLIRQSITMLGLREAGILSASVVLAGGVAYLIWNYVPSPGQKKRDTRPGEDSKSTREEDKERREEAAAEEAVAAVEAQKTSTVKC